MKTPIHIYKAFARMVAAITECIFLRKLYKKVYIAICEKIMIFLLAKEN
ncbi:hypothetical protein bmyco0002_2380 [Bacillus pseudomycoides]|nr:hypothetical protein bmyco0002_2380 [Bacillus pseudomycoides]